MDLLFDKNIDLLSKSLDLHLIRHAVTADNIANAETPYYKARRVEFEGELQRALEAQDAGFGEPSRGLASVQPIIFEDANSEMGQDMNTVDMDREMAEMNKNDVKYTAATQAISRKFSLLKYAIQEGAGGN